VRRAVHDDEGNRRITPLSARALKVTLVLDPAQVGMVLAPLEQMQSRVTLSFTVEGRRLSADFVPRSIRKMTREHGTDGVAVIVQGKLLRDDTIAEAGLVAQVRAPASPKPAVEAAA
jgi:hypothetical protein